MIAQPFGRGSVVPLNIWLTKIGWMTVVAPTDRPKSVNTPYAIGRFCSECLCVDLTLHCSCQSLRIICHAASDLFPFFFIYKFYTIFIQYVIPVYMKVEKFH